MSQQVELKIEARTDTGSKHSQAHRNNGKLPAVVYGHKKEPVAVLLDAHDFTEHLHHGHRLFDGQIGGSKETLLVKDLQYDYLGKEVIHADLMRVDLTEKVTIAVAIELKGNAPGAVEGGIVDQHLDELEVECAVESMPDSIPVSIKALNIGGVIHASDIKLPEGVELVTEPDSIIVNCYVLAEEPEEEGLEGEEQMRSPEVIGRGKEEEGESEE